MGAKVSIIMPCYNGAKTLRRAIKGVINQTYRPIEFILVNDGSEDETDQIANEMEEVILNAGIEFIYLKQQNKGLGGAINTGLKYFTGDYLAWIDADDELLPESVRIRVAFLQENKEYGAVTSNAYIATEENWNKPLGLITDNIETNLQQKQFENLLVGESIFCSGCHLIRTEAFDYANPKRDIYESRYGQNWQLLLPVYYHFKRGFINIPLYKYCVGQDNNMTAQIDKMSAEQLYTRRCEYLNIVRKTFERIPRMTVQDKRKYWRIFSGDVSRNNLFTAIENKDMGGYIKNSLKLIARNQYKKEYFTYPVRLILKRIVIWRK